MKTIMTNDGPLFILDENEKKTYNSLIKKINKNKRKTTIRLNEKAYNYIKVLSDKSKEKGKYMSMNKIIEKIIEEKMEE